MSERTGIEPNDRQALLDRAAAILADRTPIYIRMRAAERARGFRVVLPGQEPWLPRRDWRKSVVVSVADDEVRLVAVLARRPGSFTRLLAALRRVPLTPVIVCPIGPIMPAYVRRHGWRMTRAGDGWDAEDQWRPGEAKGDPHG